VSVCTGVVVLCLYTIKICNKFAAVDLFDWFLLGPIG